MRKNLLFLFVLLTIGFPALICAQGIIATNGAPAKIGFVDIEVVLDSSSAVRTIVGEIDTQLGEEDRAIETKKRDLRKLRLSLDQQSSVLSESERAQRQQEAIDLMSAIEELDYKYQRSVKEKQRTTIEPLLTQVIKIIGEVGQRDGYDLIVRGEVVLWGRETVDMTPLIVQELDKRVEELRKAVRPAAAVPSTSTAPATILSTPIPTTAAPPAGMIVSTPNPPVRSATATPIPTTAAPGIIYSTPIATQWTPTPDASSTSVTRQRGTVATPTQ
ncbi:hypothetical protein BH09SUM1_BH09SUM1_03170 [soil metagenome]